MPEMLAIDPGNSLTVFRKLLKNALYNNTFSTRSLVFSPWTTTNTAAFV